MKESHRRGLEAMKELKPLSDHPEKGRAYENPIRRGRCPIPTPSVRSMRDSTRTRWVTLSMVASPQSSVFEIDLVAHIRRRKHNMRQKIPIAYEYEGTFYIKNGNHRVAAMLLKERKKMKMRVVCLDTK